MPLHLDHIAIHARDIAAGVRFYGELLGLPEAVNPMGAARSGGSRSDRVCYSPRHDQG